jgi:hypothetical protein
MMRRLGLLVVAFIALNTTGCAVLNILLLPIQLLFSLLGALGGLVGLDDVTPDRNPPPVVCQVEGGKWLVTGLTPDAPCTIVCSAPGRETRRYAWPKDFEGRGGDVVVRLDPSK